MCVVALLGPWTQHRSLSLSCVCVCVFVFVQIYRIDVEAAQKEAAKMPKCPLEIRATKADAAKGVDYFRENKDYLRSELLKYGAVWLRGFDLMKSVRGHREMYEALGLEPCLDPLHSSGLRKFTSERDAIYEEVRNQKKETGWSVL